MPLNELIHRPLEAVEALMHQEMKSEVPLAEWVMHYIIDNGGKRFRPILTLLASGLSGKIDDNSILAGAFIEFIHSATLLHDDVVDNSPTRRGKASAHVEFGNSASVLVGDFLYTRAFQLMVRTGNFAVIQTMADAVNLIASGEVMQLTNIHNPDVDESAYYRVIELKTAVLFSSACKVAGLLNQQSEKQCEALYQFGQKLGMAFQIVDDVLDYTGNSEQLGKSLGDDLAEGKPTLALIRAQTQLNESNRQRLRTIIQEGNRDDIQEVIALLNQTDAFEYSMKQAQRLIEEALAELNHFPDSEYKSALQEIALKTIKRNH